MRVAITVGCRREHRRWDVVPEQSFGVQCAVASLVTADVSPVRPDRGTGGRFLVVLCALVVAVRATYVPRPLRNDEGGYLLIARQWHTGGVVPYGDYFVDRPPLLLLLFWIAEIGRAHV